MEKTITVEEKIRRAEEIYNRRNGNKYIYPETKKQKGPSLAKRMTKQIIICILIYGIFYAVSNKEYLTSPEFLSQIEQKAEQNETTKKAYNWTKQQIQSCINQINEKNQTNQKDKANQGETTEEQPKEGQGESQNGEHKVEQETSQNNDQKEEQQTSNDENIGGAVEETAENEQTQEQKDVEKIKNTTTFIKPIEGTISSTFGWRTPTTSTVPKYHTGVDIAAKTGTIIKSATEGKVVLASSEGDYGKHYKIQTDDLIIIYAHCSKLYLKEGENVSQGQEIAEVGSTGNSTRATFAF